MGDNVNVPAVRRCSEDLQGPSVSRTVPQNSLGLLRLPAQTPNLLYGLSFGIFNASIWNKLGSLRSSSCIRDLHLATGQQRGAWSRSWGTAECSAGFWLCSVASSLQEGLQQNVPRVPMSLCCRHLGAGARGGGKQQAGGKTGTKTLGYPPKGGPVVSQNVEVSVVQQILIFSAPLLKINNATSRGCVLAGITNGFVPVPIHPIVLWLLPSPLYLTHWSSVLYFF